jgi:dienelactone hydrolase
MRYLIIFAIFVSLLVFSCSESQPEKPNITGQEITYMADSLQMKGYLAYDKNSTAKRPGILIVHEWWGHNEYARKRARMLAELGYVALAIDMYGDGKKADHPEDAQKFAMAVMSNIESAKARFTAAMKVLKEQPVTDPERISAIGYCFGGGVVLHMARMGLDLDAVVSFHGSLGTHTPAQPGVVKAKILVCNGGADGFVTPEQIDAFKNEMDSAGVDYKFVSYEGAKHSFTNPDADMFAEKFNMPLAYNEKADKQSWQDMQQLLNQIYGK